MEGTTEENIVYQLLDVIRAAELNNDEVIGERLIRSLMRVHRAELVSKFSKEGMTIQQNFFQKIQNVKLTMLSDTEWFVKIPKIIQLANNFGIQLSNLGYVNIDVLSNEEYELGKQNPINKYQPKAKLEHQILTIYVGIPNPFAMLGGIKLSEIISCLKRREEVILSAVLDNPDDAIDYDWTVSQYPMPFELIDELKKNLLRRDFNILMSAKSDQVPNAKNDTLRYHDQGKVQE